MSKKIHYSWVVAAVTFLTLLIGAGARATPGILMIPLGQEFGWSRATISLAVAINIALYGLMGPFSAGLIERFGLRRCMVAALLILASGIGLTTQMHQVWQLIVLWGIVVGVGSGMTALVLAAVVSTRWFTAKRGTVMGAFSASTATGQLIFLPVLAHLAVGYGWRAATLTVAAAALVMAVVVAIFIRNRPVDVGLRPYGESEDTPLEPIRPAAGSPFKLAIDALFRGLKTPVFWLLAGTFFVCGASTNGLIQTHLIPACADQGIPEITAAGLLAMMGLFDFAGTTLSGWLSDRWDNRKLLAWYYGLRGLSLLYLPYAFGLVYSGLADYGVSPFYGLGVFAIFYGLDWIATVPPTVRLATQAFGKEQVGLYFGWISASHQLGAAGIAFAAGVLRVEMGSYRTAFLVAGVLCMAAAGMALMIGRGRFIAVPQPASAG
ncbi:MFS transporter [Andreprevotia chitinilytica]|uniref:MFS transporter n=1 Tax=Andreprevotia chitinilytica TaxID=396808 RepID=UPI000690BD1E|nr:MFS transporter [Andreprevotia chitinilytica]